MPLEWTVTRKPRGIRTTSPNHQRERKDEHDAEARLSMVHVRIQLGPTDYIVSWDGLGL